MAFSPVLHAKNIRMNKIASLLQTLSKFFFMPLPKDPLGYSFVFFFLKRSLVFPILFSSISLHRSLRKAFLSLLAIL